MHYSEEVDEGCVHRVPLLRTPLDIDKGHRGNAPIYTNFLDCFHKCYLSEVGRIDTFIPMQLTSSFFRRRRHRWLVDDTITRNVVLKKKCVKAQF